MSAIERLIGNPFLLNLLAQQGYAETPGPGPLGVIGRAGLATAAQRREESRADLNDQLIRARIGSLDRGVEDPSNVRSFRFFESLGDGSTPDRTRGPNGELSPAQERYLLSIRSPTFQDIPGKGVVNLSGGGGGETIAPEETIQEGLGGRAEETSAGTTRGEIGTISPAQRAVDTAFATEYTAWLGGGQSDTLKGISQLRDVREALKGAGNLTGRGVGVTPGILLPFVNPKAANVKETVEEVVQRNLKAILGAQFTEREGERLISRAYNPKLEESMNVERLDRLIAQMEVAADEKNAQAAYFQANGTLQGYEGKIFTIEDFEKLYEDDDEDTSLQGEIDEL